MIKVLFVVGWCVFLSGAGLAIAAFLSAPPESCEVDCYRNTAFALIAGVTVFVLGATAWLLLTLPYRRERRREQQAASEEQR